MKCALYMKKAGNAPVPAVGNCGTFAYTVQTIRRT